MRLRPIKRTPVVITCAALALVCLLHLLQLDSLDRIEWMTYDKRVRLALHFNPPPAQNLGFVFVDEASVEYVRTNQDLGFGLYWPRSIYGQAVDELREQGAKAVAFDVIFGELRPDHPQVAASDGFVPRGDGADSRTNDLIAADEYFARELRQAGNVILAFTTDKPPAPLFATNAWALGAAMTGTGADEIDQDADGVLRRARAFRTYRVWHKAFRQMEADPGYGVDLRLARVEGNQIVLPRHLPADLGARFSAEDKEIRFKLDPDGNFDLADFYELPPGMARYAKPFTEQRVWHMGIVVAARELGFDLDRTEVDLPRGRITFRGTAPGNQRVLPVDRDSFFYINWTLRDDHPALTRQPIEELLAQHAARIHGRPDGVKNHWRAKLAIVGSRAVGHDLNDMGATPLGAETWFVSNHWNVANTLITGAFVRRSSLAADLALIVLLGCLAAAITLQFRALRAAVLVLLVMVGYVAIACGVYVGGRYWMPVVMPVAGAAALTYVSLLVWKIMFEQAERRRIRSVFSTLVHPRIVNQLLKQDRLSLMDGARREITILFADVRGFTEFTDAGVKRVAEYVEQQRLSKAEAEAQYDLQAQEILNTVNLYLGLVAAAIDRQQGTLDKFIGDCVMAFWNDPLPDSQHARSCVRAAIDAQWTIYELNRERARQNAQRELENQARAAAGLTPLPMLPILLLGTGINTGMATLGLMGSGGKTVVRQGNYTAFGREVNLASRLEGASGRGRIFISEATYEHLRRDDPALAAACLEVPERIKLKGFSSAIRAFEVPWRPPSAISLEEEFHLQRSSETTTLTKEAAKAMGG